MLRSGAASIKYMPWYAFQQLNKRFDMFFPITGGCSEGLGAF